MSYLLKFELKGLPRSQINTHGHWRSRHTEKKDWMDRVVVATMGNWPDKPLERATVTFTRFSTTEPDYTNLVASMKNIEDGLILARIILDDSPAVVGQPTYRWEKIGRGKGKVGVEVESKEIESTKGIQNG